jgi:hypothetical protein
MVDQAHAGEEYAITPPATANLIGQPVLIRRARGHGGTGRRRMGDIDNT